MVASQAFIAPLQASKVFSMNNRNLKDAKRRNAFHNIEETRVLYKAIIKDQSISPRVRFDVVCALNALPRIHSRVRIGNRCVLTGRSKAVLRKFKISRICLRDLVALGALAGVTKASW